MHSDKKTVKVSVSGPHDRVYRWLSHHPEAKVSHLQRNEGYSKIDTISVLVQLTTDSNGYLELLSSYNLDYKVLYLDGYVGSCPLIQSALSKDKR